MNVRKLLVVCFRLFIMWMLYLLNVVIKTYPNRLCRPHTEMMH